jgi:putative acetyltransferase
VIVRPERPDEVDEIHAVVAASFESDVEARLVRDIRDDACYRPSLALVAEEDDDIVGHVMVSHCELHDGDVVHRIGMLSPLAVRPDRQRDGIGSALVRQVCALADDAGDPIVILEGSPQYYPRFGFVDARTLGITIHLPDWAPPEAGQALPLVAYDSSLRGTVVYPPPFHGLE